MSTTEDGLSNHINNPSVQRQQAGNLIPTSELELGEPSIVGSPAHLLEAVNNTETGPAAGAEDDTRTGYRKLLNNTGLLALTGTVSNTIWYASMALNRVLEKTETPSLLPAVGLGLVAVGTENTMASISDRGDFRWDAKSRFSRMTKRLMSHLPPLVVTSWRGAASGVALDKMHDREITRERKLAHSAVYGFFISAWVTKPGSEAFNYISAAASEAIDKPGAAIAATLVALGGLAKAYHNTPEESA